MTYQIIKLIINAIFVLFWFNAGFDYFIAGLEALKLTQYFTNIPLWVVFLVATTYVPPVLFTYYLWFKKR